MALAQLSIDLVAKVAAFERDIKRTADATVAQSQRMAVAFDLVKGGIAGIVAGFSAGALVSFVRTTVDAVDALNDVADATGATIENISALEDVARRTGTNLDAVSGILVKFNSVLADADPSKGAGAVIKSLNLDIEALKRQDPAEALRQVAVALSGYADDGNKARAVQELFGKSVKEAAPFLKDLAENGQLNAKVTTAQAAEAEKFNKELFKLQTNASNAARVITMDLVSSINQLYGALSGSGETGKLSEWLAVPLQTASVLGANLAFVIKGIATEIGGIAAQAAAVARLDFRGAVSIGEMMKADAQEARTALDALERRLLQIGKATSQTFEQSSAETARLMRQGAAPTLRTPVSQEQKNPRTSTTTPRDPAADAKRYLDSLQGQLQSAKALTATEKLLDDIRRGAIGKFTPELEKQLRATAAQVDATKALTDAEKERAQNQKGLDDLVDDIGRRDQKRLDAMLGASDSGRLEKQRDDMLFLAEAYEQGRLGAVGSEEAMRKFSESAQAYLGTGGAVPEAMDAMAQSAIQAAERIQGALGDELTNILSGEFDNIGDSFAKLIQRMVAEAAAAKIMDGLFGAVDAGTKQRSGGGLLDDAAKWLGSLIPSANGNVFPAGPGISAYSSQVVSKPTIFPFAKGIGLMGEAGAEAIMPLRRDSAGRLGVSAAGASVTVNVINQSGQPVSAQQRSRSGPNGEQIVDVVLAAIGDSLANRSGPVARGLESGYGLRPAMA